MEQGLPLEVLAKSVVSGSLKEAAYREGIWQSKINLAFVTQSNEDDVAHKAFRITACGGFLLALRTPGHQAAFAEDKEAVFFSTVEECAEKARYYLDHEAEREAIARRGRERAVSFGNHLCRCRSELFPTGHLSPTQHLHGQAQYPAYLPTTASPVLNGVPAIVVGSAQLATAAPVPIRAGTVKITNPATTQAVTFGTAMGSTPTSCSLTPSGQRCCYWHTLCHSACNFGRYRQCAYNSNFNAGHDISMRHQ